MNADDGHEMLVARCKALEVIAKKYISLFCEDHLGNKPTDLHVKEMVEARVELLAPGCSHQVR